MMYRFIIILFLLLAAPIVNAAACSDNTVFKVGAGIHDITGPAAEVGMMGYGMINQQTGGLSQRLWARAFVIESPCNGKRVTFVNADLGQVFQGVKQHVIERLQKKYGKLYNDQNVLITAIHTHSGPGGFSTYAFYNITTLGFNRRNFDTIVDGIVAAIEHAQANMTKAQIKMATGDLRGINFNRSPAAYQENPQQERNLYQSDTDTKMTLIRFDSLDGKPIGLINWFPVHGVSLNNKNRLISGDNKGFAEYLFEKDFNSDYGATAFVAAFAQENAGDVSSNQFGRAGGDGLQGLEAVNAAGRPQYEMAKKLYASANEIVRGGVDYRHQFVEMDKVEIDPIYTDGVSRRTCPAAIGVSMLAGTQDGEGVGYQGISCDSAKKFFPRLFCELVTTSCQGVKPIVLEPGSMQPYPWTPSVLPFQVFRIGNLVIGAAPFELTTMTGRRIRSTMAKQLSGEHVVLSALSNAYAGYVATKEEYQLQRYEGASTHFGPWTAAALQQEFARLTFAMVNDKTVDQGPAPADLLDAQWDFQTGVVFDDKPLWKNFGDVYEDVKPVYKRGETVQVIFWGAHPKNNFRIQDTFLQVQHLENGKWVTVKRDRDWETEYHWMRSGVANSLITIVWRTTSDAAPGQYRIVHHGDWKSGWSWNIYPYAGQSSIFVLE